MADEIIDLLQVRIEKARAALPVETVNAIAAVDWKAAIIGLRARNGYTFEQLGDLELETELLLCGLVSPEDYPKELERRMKISGSEANELVNTMNDLVFKRIREELIKNAERKKIFSHKKSMAEPDVESGRVKNSIASIPTTENLSPKVLSKDIIEERALLVKDGIEIIDRPALPGDLSRSGAEKPLSESLTSGTPPNREDILKKIEKKDEIHPLLAQKFSSPLQMPMVQTEYSLNNISKTSVDSTSLQKSGLPSDVVAMIKPVEGGDVKPSKSYSKNADPYRISPNE